MKSNGFIAISTMLIVSVVVLAITLSLTYLSIGEAQSSLALSKGESSLNLVEGCAEDYLNAIRSDPNYAGASIIRPEGTCQITVNSHVGIGWTINVTSTSNLYNRTLRLILNRYPTGITLLGWQEI